MSLPRFRHGFSCAALVLALAGLIGLSACDSGGGSSPRYTLTTTVEGEGRVTLSPSGGEYEDGTEVTLTAEPADGWAFAEWDAGYEAAGEERSITTVMNRDKSARAVFQEVTEPGSELIPFAGTELFLSGGNVAWVNFARDVGPGETELSTFGDIFQEAAGSGGNAMRLWLHTSGATTPFWDGAPLQDSDSDASSTVTGPGEGTIDDLRAILDRAEAEGVGLVLCLWSFDMLRDNDFRADDVPVRNRELLTEEGKLQAYLDNALAPMVEELQDHPALLAWEVFNEPEGMSEEFGYTATRVPMRDIQRVINRVAGTIHDIDSDALVTNGSDGFSALGSFDEPVAAARAQQRSAASREDLRRALSAHYRMEATQADVRQFYRNVQAAGDRRYYSDQALIDAGGDANGTLDFFSVHYYEYEPEWLSPFNNPKSKWGLDKPLVVAEFFTGAAATTYTDQGPVPGTSDGDQNAIYGVEQPQFYTALYERGYAGALGWQWFNYPVSAEGAEEWPRILENIQVMQDTYPGAVDVSL